MTREQWIRLMWRGQAGGAGRTLSILLLPLSAAFRLVLWTRDFAYGLGWARSHRAEIPVVSVGNLTVGGTGKTPLSRWVVERLRADGRSPAVVLRGYGSDEVALHRRWAPEVPVVAAADRIAGVATAVRNGAGVAVLDDAFQHRRLARDLDIVLLAAEEPFPGPVLPRGAYREPAAALERASVIIITRKRASVDQAAAVEDTLRRLGLRRPVVKVHLRPAQLRPLAAWASESLESESVDGAMPEGPIRVASGVADPDTVVASVRTLGLQVADRRDFADHHDFTPADLAHIRDGARTIVVTEKDAIKLQQLAPEAQDIFVLEQEVIVEQGEEVLERLLRDLPTASRTAGGARGNACVDPPGSTPGSGS